MPNLIRYLPVNDHDQIRCAQQWTREGQSPDRILVHRYYTSVRTSTYRIYKFERIMLHPKNTGNVYILQKLANTIHRIKDCDVLMIPDHNAHPTRWYYYICDTPL